MTEAPRKQSRARGQGPGEWGETAILSRKARAGLTEQRCKGGEPQGHLGGAFQVVGASAKALGHEHACARSHLSTRHGRVHSCTQMHTDPKAGPGQHTSPSAPAGARSNRANSVSRPPSALTKAAPARGWDRPPPTQAPGPRRETRRGTGEHRGLRDEEGREEGPEGRRALKLHREMEAVAMHYGGWGT